MISKKAGGLTLSFLFLVPTLAGEEVSFHSPGFPPTVMDDQGSLKEDWGSVTVRLETDASAGAATVEEVLLDDLIPAARASWNAGGIGVETTAFRAPIWPAGVDVLTVRIAVVGGKAARGRIILDLSAGARIGDRSVSIGGRTVLLLPRAPETKDGSREWGYNDDAVSMPGWASPKSGFDPAFANIRAGMGGVPIVYRFSVEPKSAADLVLGFCESHWESPGSRFMSCKVEGADLESIDPLARFGRHQPGGVLFEGKDSNSDGWLDLLVLPAPGSPDRNPILNAVWVLPPGQQLEADQVITGQLNTLAQYYVDVGGEQDQSIHPPGKLAFPITLPAGGTEELTFLVACQGGSAPTADGSTWTPESLHKAARDVWNTWRTE